MSLQKDDMGLVAGLAMYPFSVTTVEPREKKNIIVNFEKAGIIDTAYTSCPGLSAVDSCVGIETVSGVYKSDIKYTQLYSGSPISATINVERDCLLITAVAARGNIIINGTGWQKVAYIKTTEMTPLCEMTVFTKNVAAGRHSVTVACDNGGYYMSIKLIALYQAQSISLVDSILCKSTIVTPTPTGDKKRLYLLSGSPYYNLDYYVLVSKNGDMLYPLTDKYFSAYYDFAPVAGTVPEFNNLDATSEAPNNWFLLTFDINDNQEEQ